MSYTRSFTARTIAAVLALILPTFCTSFLGHTRLLGSIEDPGWYEDNVPFVELPDQKIQDVYYYRLQSYKEHLFYTGTEDGYISTEFLLPLGYGGPYGGIVAAAGHHITESRWRRDVTYGQDLVKYWLAGPGISAKEATYGLNPDTSDWVHQYSFWAASSVWKQYLVTGALDFAVSQLDNLVQYYAGYGSHFNKTLNLYWQAPVWDASEYTAASYETDPWILIMEAMGTVLPSTAIISVTQNANLAQEYESRSKAIENATQALLWDEDLHFFKHRARDNNPSGSLLDTREIMGYLPWMFNMSLKPDFAEAFTQLMDASGFSSTYGPTTTEKRSSWYMHEAEQGCCRWSSPAWPFATSQTLTAVENLLNDYPAQSYITSSDYFTLVTQYAAMHSKNGQPYVAEAHWPDKDAWQYDTEGHSEDYNHSKFVDNILTGLLGLRHRAGRSLVVNPLIPTSWSYFGGDDVWHAIDDTIFRVGIPKYTRWTTYESPNKIDWYTIIFVSSQTLTEVDLYFCDDAGGVRLPASYDLHYLDATHWSTVPDQALHGKLTTNAQARILFPSITSTALRVVAPNGGDGVSWGLSEFEVWEDLEEQKKAL